MPIAVGLAPFPVPGRAANDKGQLDGLSCGSAAKAAAAKRKLDK